MTSLELPWTRLLYLKDYNREPTRGSKKGIGSVRLVHEIDKYVSESGLGVEYAGDYVGSPMWNSNIIEATWTEASEHAPL